MGSYNQQSKIINRNSIISLVGVSLLFRDRNHASVCNFTDGVFELNRGVVDAELCVEAALDITEDTFADGRRNVGDGDVTGERASLRAEVPYMQVVDVIDSLNFT